MEDGMAERQQIVVCTFDPRSPRISAYQIHEWIYERMGLGEDEVCLIQIDRPRRKVYIKFVSETRLDRLMRETNGTLTYRHANGEQSQVLTEKAGVGLREIRVANLPP
jgi:hypothetical protein